jgi:hypothetical protein
MFRLAFAALTVGFVLLCAQPVSARASAPENTIILNEAAPIHQGDTVTFSFTLQNRYDPASASIYVRCYQPQQTDPIYDVNAPAQGNSFTLTFVSPPWDSSIEARCAATIAVYDNHYHNIVGLATTSFSVIP